MHKIIAEIASDASKLHKEAVINREAKANNRIFMKGLRYGLDNQTTFGVKKVPIREGEDGPGLTWLKFTDLAENLIERELTGHEALNHITACMCLATNDEWNGWYRLILTKDFRAGFSESTVNKAVKDVNKEFVIPTTPYMRCSLPEDADMENWDWAAGVYSQIKADGMFVNVNVRDGDKFVWITSRNGTLFPEDSLGIEVNASRTLKAGTQTHGELTVFQDDELLERQVGNGILNSVLKGGKLEANQKVVFDAWDQIPLSEAVPKGHYKVPYKARFSALESQINSVESDIIRLIEGKIVYSMAEAQKHYREVRRRKLEGTIMKSPELPWKDHTSKFQVKCKAAVEVDVKVVGFEPGKGKYEGMIGSILCHSEDDLMEFGAGGITDDMRKEITDNPEKYLHSILCVAINGIMYSTKKDKLHSAFLPQYREWRMDKTVADNFAEIEKILANSIEDEPA